jgi:hypothetical protein
MATSRIESNPGQAPSPQVRAGGSLWTLQKNGRSIECALYCGAGRIEVQIRRDGELCAGSAFDEFEQALAHGQALLLDLHATGWQSAH